MDVQYKIDKITFELKPETSVPIAFEEPIVVSVTLPNNRKVSFRIQKIIEAECWITSDYGKICIKTEKLKDWERFLSYNFMQVVGLCTTALITKGKEDFLWIEPSNNNKVWILGVVWNNNHWDGMLVERERKPFIFKNNKDYFFTLNNRDKKAKQIFNLLQDKKKGLGLPNDFPFFSKNSTISKEMFEFRRFTIKVHPNEVWFFVFPFDHFCRLKYGHFSLYRGFNVEWILTLEKSFIQNTYERLQIQRELSDVCRFLKHSVIILNTYPYEEEVQKKVDEGMKLIKKIINYLQNIEFDTEEGSEVLSLQWYLNPTEDKIKDMLKDENIWYFLADFHVENGVWQIGKEKNNPTSIDLHLKFLKQGDLKHIRLLRIYNCRSVLGPDFNPNWGASIVSSLLNAGAFRVEGSIIDADLLDYLCSLLFMFCHQEGLQLILIGKCLENGINFSDIKKEVNEFLKSCNWETIPEKCTNYQKEVIKNEEEK